MSRAHWNLIQIQPHLVRLFPKSAPLHICQGRTVIAADMDGVITEGAEVGLFVHETRMLSRWRYLINEAPPLPIVLSNVQQHSWLGYYIFLPREAPTGEPDYGSGVMQPITEQSLELRVSRFVGEGFHEDVDLTNYTSEAARFTLAIEVDADFADLEETRRKRQQHGELNRDWRRRDDGRWELDFDYKARHRYRHQGDSGTAQIHRGLTVRVCEAGSPPTYADGRLSFEIELKPGASWHVCFDADGTGRERAAPLAVPLPRLPGGRQRVRAEAPGLPRRHHHLPEPRERDPDLVGDPDPRAVQARPGVDAALRPRPRRPLLDRGRRPADLRRRLRPRHPDRRLAIRPDRRRPAPRQPRDAGGFAGDRPRRLARRAARPDAARGPLRAAGESELRPLRPLLRLDDRLGLLPGRPGRALALDRRPRPGRAARRAGAGRPRLARRATATSTATASTSTRPAPSQGVVNQAWKDSPDAMVDERRPGRRHADRRLRDPGVRLRRQAPLLRGPLVARPQGRGRTPLPRGDGSAETLQ